MDWIFGWGGRILAKFYFDLLREINSKSGEEEILFSSALI